jgi:hypothetical protein
VPVALEGVELLALVLTFACFGLALAIQHGLLQPLSAVVRHVPVAGGALAGRIDDMGNAMVGYLLQALGYQLRLVVTTWHGLTAVFQLLVDPVVHWVHSAETALHTLRHGIIPGLIKAAVAPALKIAHEGKTLATEGWNYAHAQVARLDGKINHWTQHFTQTVENPWLYFQRHIWPDAKAELDAVHDAVTRRLPAELATVEGEASRALAEAGTIGAQVESAVSHAVGTVPADVLAAERAVAAELPGLTGLDLPDVEKLLRNLPWATLAGLLAAVPLLRLLTQTIAAESGLDRAECRRKVRGICSTDPAAWERLLAGLLPLGVGFTLAELIEAGVKVVGESESVINELVGQG